MNNSYRKAMLQKKKEKEGRDNEEGIKSGKMKKENGELI